jgi:nucleotide-binding universal stress UspA family protein
MTAWPDGPILCGIDFSDDSRHAWLVARTLAHQLDRSLVVVTAIDPLLAEAGKAKYGEKFVEDGASADLAKFLFETDMARVKARPDDPPMGRRTASGGLWSESFEFATAIEVGSAPEAVLKAAHEHEAALIVVGTRGLGRTKRLFFGSTALKILRHADRPVLAVPHAETAASGAAGSRFTHIVCGVDFSEPSMQAAQVASDLGRRIGASITLVHAVAQIAVPQTWDLTPVSAADQRMSEATSRLAELAATLDAVSPGVSVRIGNVADVISEAASTHPATLILLGLDGRDGHRPGTHAYRILMESKTPVLAVPRSK